MKYLLLLLLVSCVSAPPQESVTEYRLKQIQLGDSYYKVRELLGPGREEDVKWGDKKARAIVYSASGVVPRIFYVNPRTMKVFLIDVRYEDYMTVQSMHYEMAEEE